MQTDPFDLLSAESSHAPKDLEQLELHLAQLCEAIQESLDTPKISAAALSHLTDNLRWTRFYVNISLAFRRQVHPLRDEAWAAATYTGEGAARELLSAFCDSAKGLTRSRLNLVELRNLSVRVEGLGSVLDTWSCAVG